MNYRQAIIHARQNIVANTTFTIDLAGEDPFSRLTLYARATNNSSTPLGHPAMLLTRIELVDGSNVLFALAGNQCQAQDFYHRLAPPPNVVDDITAGVAIAAFNINFGRYLWDPELAFNPARFKNPQLRVSYDIDGSNTGCALGEFQVVAEMFDEKKINPIGMLVHKQHYGYTLVANAFETITLPTDMVLKQLIVMSLHHDQHPWQNFNSLRLAEDHQKRIIFDDMTSRLQRSIFAETPEYVETIRLVSNVANMVHYSAVTEDVRVAQTGMDGSQNTMATNGLFGGTIGFNGSVNAQNVHAVVVGRCPHGALGFQFGDRMNLDDWYDTRKVKDLELRIQAGAAAAGTCEILTQQLYRY